MRVVMLVLCGLVLIGVGTRPLMADASPRAALSTQASPGARRSRLAGEGTDTSSSIEVIALGGYVMMVAAISTKVEGHSE